MSSAESIPRAILFIAGLIIMWFSIPIMLGSAAALVLCGFGAVLMIAAVGDW